MQDCTVVFVRESEVRQAVAAAFENMRGRLASLLPDARIEHVGSTAVPGSITKGDLDVCVLVPPGAFAGADRILAQHFPRNVGSDRSESLSSFVDGGDGRDGGGGVAGRGVPIGIQLVACGGPEDSFVAWREMLRRSPRLLEAYNDLKRRWHGRPHDQYRTAKSQFIEDALSSGPPADAGSPGPVDSAPEP